MHNPFTIFTDSLHIGFSQSGIALMRSSGLFKKQKRFIKEQTFDTVTVEQCLSDLNLLLSENQCQRLKTNLFISNSWVRFFIVTPPSNASRFQDCQAAAEVRFTTLFGESASTWVISADWQLRHPFLACAIPSALLTGLKKITAEHHLSLLKIEPQLITYLNRLHKTALRNSCLGIFNEGTLDLVMTTETGAPIVRKITYTNEETEDQQWLYSTIQQEALRHNTGIPQTFYYGGQLSKIWQKSASTDMDYLALDSNEVQTKHITHTHAMRLANGGQI